MRASSCRGWNLLLGVGLAVVMAAVPLAQQRGGGGPRAEAFQFRFLGPAVGNRVASVAGVPGDPYTYYAGAASGGVWKTIDGGNRWTPIADGIPVAAIGALAVAPSDPKIVWAGTGEAWAIRDIDVMGDGVYKSVDAGQTWTHMGLDETGRIARVLVHPTNPNIVFVCAVGRTTGPQKERGIFRTADGGQHWDQVLLPDENTGCSGLTMDAHNPNVMFAGTWQVEMHTWAMFSGGPGSGIYASRDGGTTWKKVESPGLPRPPVGKIDVAIAPSDSNRVYALIQTKDQGSLWRSDDGGASWRVVNWQRGLIGRAGYYIRLAISPTDPDEVMVADSSFWVSTDGGQNFNTRPWGGDTHDIWIDPTNADRFVITDDGGMTIVLQHGRITNRVTLPIGQMYHVAVDDQVPYWIYGNMQDDGTMRGVSTGPEAGGGGRGGNVWEHGLGGCESGFTIPDPVDPNIVWASCYGNKLTRYDARTKTARSVAPWMITLDSAPNESKYRCHWTAPLAIDPFDHNSVYYGCQVIFKTTNGGQSWTVISPDLSTQDPSRIVSSGGIVADNLGQFAPEVVFAIAPSEIQKGLIWAGTNDGKVWYTKDGGTTWTDVTKNIAGMPAWGTITRIEPSHFDAGAAYIAVDFHLMDNREPFIYKTADFGQTWKKISDGLPGKHPLAYVRAIAEDPNRKGVLFAGTGHGFYYSLDDGGAWTQMQAGLPQAPVTWIVVQKQFRDVVVSTYGRGLYILDDITPLEQMAAQPATDAQLFAPRATYRFARGGRAFITFSLKAAPKEPGQIQILDAAGQVIRQMQAPGRAGLNRAGWDLRYDPPRLVALRTTPPEGPHIWEEPRFKGAETRPVTHWGMAQAQVGPMVAPGTYSVRLTVDGQSFTQSIEIVKDPRFTTTQADLEASVRLQLRIRDDINATSDMINRMEVMRRQLEDGQKDLRGQQGKDNLLQAVSGMHRKITDVEDKLLEPAMRLSDDKYFVQAYHVYTNLIWLNGEVGPGAGDVAGGTDFRPTDTSVKVLETIEADLNGAKAEYAALVKTEIPAFNQAIAGTGLKPITP
jgi:photosystem II stability/assembly factor-like uncharacterized protein